MNHIQNGSFLMVVCLVFMVQGARAQDCSEAESPILCHGSRVMQSVVNQVLFNAKRAGALQIVPGLEIVKTDALNNDTEDAARSADNDGYLNRVANYLQEHELKIKLPELLNKMDYNEVLQRSLKNLDNGDEVVGKLTAILKELQEENLNI